jgi:hypothetical protein
LLLLLLLHNAGPSPRPNSWSDVTILQENRTITAANAARFQFMFAAGSCANVQKTTTLGGQATIQCFKPDGMPDWPMTAKWLSLSLQNTVVPGDAPACDLLPELTTITPATSAADSVAVAAAPAATAEPAAAADLDAAVAANTLFGLALPTRTTCPFYARYVYGGDLAAEIGASRCVFKASLYCVKPETAASAAAAAKSLMIGTAANTV